MSTETERTASAKLSKPTALRTIAADILEDARDFEGKSFSGVVIGHYMGNHGAAIAAIAEFLADALEQPCGRCGEAAAFPVERDPVPYLDYLPEGLPARIPPALTVEGIGPMVKQLREAQGWTCERLAAEAGVAKAYVSLVETGRRVPHTPKLIAILDALEADLVVVKR